MNEFGDGVAPGIPGTGMVTGRLGTGVITGSWGGIPLGGVALGTSTADG